MDEKIKRETYLLSNILFEKYFKILTGCLYINQHIAALDFF